MTAGAAATGEGTLRTGAETAPAALALIGCGRMGRALLDGWLRAGSIRLAHVVDPATDLVPSDPRVRGHADIGTLKTDGPLDALVIAVKPQMMGAVLPRCAALVSSDTLVISIAAGTTIARIDAALVDARDQTAEQGAAAPAIVRAMPNTPAAIGHGISVCCASPGVSDGQRRLADRLLSAVGSVAWIEAEGMMDAVTAVSGSGPAYVFLLVEAMTRAGERLGLPPDLAARLARETVSGAGHLLERSCEPPAALRQAVTSPGGTTRAALDVLMADDGLQPLFDRALAAAAKRAAELA